jgi:hypothetical protein
MFLQRSITALLLQLHQSVEKLTDEQYRFPVRVLSDASVGQHLRHVIEFYEELFNGYDTGLVNYDRRKRDHRIETDRSFALQKLLRIGEEMNRPDKTLSIMASFATEEGGVSEFKTNYGRELLYNLEHTVHHMALIRVGIEAVSAIRLPVQFGVAESTIQSRQLCAP